MTTGLAPFRRAAGVPFWLPVTALLVTLGGLAVSGYLGYEHFTAETTLVCPNDGGLNCEKVTSSAQSKLFGVPVALLGVGYFAAMCPLVLPAAWQPAPARWGRWLTAGRLAGTGAGVIYVLYLVYAELFAIGSICVWCTVVHLLAFALFGLVLFGWALATTGEPEGGRDVTGG